MFRFLNAILPYVFLITGFWKEGNGVKNFEFNLWKKSLIDQDIQSAHKALKKLFLYFDCLHNFKL